MIGSFKDRRGLAACLLLCAALAVLAAGCGGGDDSSSETSATPTSTPESTGGETEESGEGGSAVIEEAEAEVAKYTAPQAPIEVEPIAKPPKSGVKLAVISCPLPVCQTAIGGAEEAAKAVGWSVSHYEDPLTPEGYQNAWNEALQGNPGAIIYIGIFPEEFIAKQFAQAKEREIPTAVISPAGEKPSKTGPVYATIHGPKIYEKAAKLEADSILADHGEGPKAVYIYDKTQEATNGAEKPAFESELKKGGGSVDSLEVSSEQIGKQIPSQVVSYVQSHPDVEYVVFNLNDYTAGVSAALAAGGLSDKVKIVSRAAGKSQVKELENGQLFASTAEEDNSTGWRAVDAMIKVLNGEDNFEPVPEEFIQIVNAENATELGFEKLGFYETPGSPQAFLKAWGVSGE